MPPKGPVLPGYTPVTPRIFLRNEKSEARTASETEPTTILVYGWGDGLPKNVMKYAEGYHALFPSARIFVMINPILGATMHTLRKRTDAMRPLVDAVFSGRSHAETLRDERIIMHIMSNTGGIYAAATLNAYREKFGADAGLPHHLCVSDSTPGSLIFSTEVWRWARAMALGMPKWLPWPFAATQFVCCAYLYFMQYLARLMRIEPSGEYSCKVFLDRTMATQRALRLYMYSKEDDLIYWKDVEAQAATAASKGYTTVLERFEGSPHVGHMRMHPEKYWGIILRCWKQAMEMQEGHGNGNGKA